MKNDRHYAVILGARPNFIKAAPFFKRAREYPECSFTIIHTGQHFDENMSRIFFHEMEIPRPDIYFNLEGATRSDKTGAMIHSLKNLFKENRFDAIITFGDVDSTLAGAISGVKLNHKLVHIEAGLRSFDRRMPEEMNRVIVDHLSDLLFTTEPSANKNLENEGCEPDIIKYVGNIMIETIEIFKNKINQSPIRAQLGLAPKKYVYATIHRQENIYDRETLKNILLTLNAIQEDAPIVLPLHPATRNRIEEFGLKELLSPILTIQPLGYFESLKLISESMGVITDSGGIQEETTHLGIPCCTLRDNTERPITIELGSNKLFPTRTSSASDLLAHLKKTNFKSCHIPLWDKDVSKRIFEHLIQTI